MFWMYPSAAGRFCLPPAAGNQTTSPLSDLVAVLIHGITLGEVQVADTALGALGPATEDLLREVLDALPELPALVLYASIGFGEVHVVLAVRAAPGGPDAVRGLGVASWVRPARRRPGSPGVLLRVSR